MGKDNAPIPSATEEQFPTLAEAAKVPRSPPKTMRIAKSSRKCDDIAKTARYTDIYAFGHRHECWSATQLWYL